MPLLLFAVGFARFEAGQKAMAGVVVAGMNVGGMPADALRARLSEQARLFGPKKLSVGLGTRRISVTAEELGVTLLVDESLTRALAVGRDAGAFANAVRYARSFWHAQALEAATRVDGARFDAALTQLERTLIDDLPFAGGIAIEGTTPRALPPRAGRRLSQSGARRALIGALSLGHDAATLTAESVTPQLGAGALERALASASRALAGRVTLEAGARELSLEPVELSALMQCSARGPELEVGFELAKLDGWLAPRRSALEAPARAAGFEVSATDEVRVVPAEAGIRLVTEDVARALWSAAQSDERQGVLPLRREPLPARSTEQAQQLGIRKLVSSFTTRHPCCQSRVENIHRIATLLDGLVVEPGQTVSVNAVVGPRTQKNGFVLAPGIEDGEMVDTMGGGVSQFATTFFNALFHGGYDIVERQPHSYWFPRYPMGHEATLSWPKPDIVFKNDTSAGLLVKTQFSGTTITVKLYGDTFGRRVTSSVSERREIVRPPVELLPNRELPPDEEKVKDGGMIGWSVIASRIVTFADGTKKEERRKVTYKPKARRVEVHPCRIPDGEPGATGERCPEPEDAEQPERAASAEQAATSEVPAQAE